MPLKYLEVVIANVLKIGVSKIEQSSLENVSAEVSIFIMLQA